MVAEVCARLAYYHGEPTKALDPIKAGVLILDFSLNGSVSRVRNLMRKYGDQPMDFADACLVVMSEEHGDCEVVTIDQGDFKVYRRFGREVIPIVAP